MKTKFNGFLTLFIALVVQISFAQQKTISGTVSDGSGPLPGVSILIKGTNTGTETDFDGKYSIKASAGNILVFRYLGYKTVEKAVKNSNILNITLEEGGEILDEIVVTALGISKKERGLGVTVGKVNSESLTRARSASPINALAGKVSGLKITQQSGTPGGSATVIVRGATSLDGDNQPIFVIDGMPISNQSINTDGIAGGIDGGNRAGDLNPDDIESISVLKGASASALYGARAKNGAIIITTKRGKEGSMKVEINSSVRFDSALVLPEYQNEYAQGTAGTYDKDRLNGWGPKISDVQNQTFEDFKGDQVTLKANPNNVEDFFNVGNTKINTFAVSGGDTKSDYRFSFTNTDVTGIVPNSSYVKNNFSINAGRNFSDKLSIRTNISYISSRSAGRTQQGSNDSNVVIDDILGIPRTVSFKDLENNYIDEAGNQIGLTQRGNNPYWVLNKNSFSTNVERIIAASTFQYKINENFKIVERIGTDFYNESRQKLYAKGTIGRSDGRFTNFDYYNQIINNDLYLSYNKTNFEGLSVSAILGHNLYQTRYKRTTITGDDLTVPGLYNFGNAANLNTSTDFKRRRELYGVYGEVNLDYQNTYFLTLTGRNDWSSTLPKENNSYFYPSVNAAIVFSEFIENNDILSFGKIRGGYAEVGSDANAYSTKFGFNPSSTYYVQYSLSNSLPQNGIIGFQVPRQLPNANLRPQRKKEYEFGADLKMFKNILGLGFTYYNSDTEDQLIDVDVPLSSGFFTKFINAGNVNNKGIEVDVNFSPFKNSSGDFKWDLNVIYNQNTQKITDLPEGTDEFQLQSGWSGLTIKASPGEEFGLYGTAFKRNDQGQFVINEATGLKEIEANKRLGNTAPDWTMGINNSFTYKSFGISFLIDIKQGGTLYSGTTAALRSAGLAVETLENRGETFIDNGVNEVIAANGDITYKANTTPVQNLEEYWGHQSATSNTEGNIFDASYVKLREISLFYSIPSQVFKNSFFSSVRFGIEARNLWIIDSKVPHIDPEVNFFGSGGSSGATVEFASVPSVKSIGFNVNLTF